MQPRRYLATFAAGFEPVIGELLGKTLPGAALNGISSGIVSFGYSGALDSVMGLDFFNNAFLSLREWNTNLPSFHDLVVSASTKSELPRSVAEILPIARGSFRVRFSRENQFCPVDKKVMELAERHIAREAGLRPDRCNPGIEFWYGIRREGRSFFACRLTKKATTEKYLEPGELRPEIAQLIVAVARVGSSDRVIIDPFAGHGAIPAQVAALTDSACLASDIDPKMVSFLARRFGQNARVRVRQGDALSLDWIDSGSVDVVITDPPWGFWEGDAVARGRSIDALYEGMLLEFSRILRRRGRAIVLTGAKREFEGAVTRNAHFASSAAREGFRIDILVNGRKSAVFSLERGVNAQEPAFAEDLSDARN